VEIWPGGGWYTEILAPLTRAKGQYYAAIGPDFPNGGKAVEALKAGAYDYLTKPVDLRQFRLVVGSARGRGVPGAAPPPVGGGV
ncbi:hypothetical protein RVY79_20850, partial [Chromohalobacter sp. HP20-39]|nr:hypothetical protein [Chromohalobacter sp. HP20-39]